MPKIIENARSQILEEARRILKREGYTALTIRKTANALGIGVGTIYNYFPSKEYLAAGVMLEDWKEITRRFSGPDAPGSPEGLLHALFDQLRSFSAVYSPVWEDYEQHKGSVPLFDRYHRILIEELSGYIRASLPPEQVRQEPYLAGFLAALVLRFAADRETDYASIRPGILKLLKPL